MGGSASNGNAQLFSLMSQYGGDTAQPSYNDQINSIQKGYNNWMKSGGDGARGVFDPQEAFLHAFITGMHGGGGSGSTGGTGTGTGTGTVPTTGGPGPVPRGQWAFPQYTQTWAFTPPTPTPYMTPGPFDTKKYGNPLTAKNVKKNT
jgi:hypothetical protein